MPTDNAAAAVGQKVYRDGDHLVAALKGAVFPNRCVVTNQANATWFHYRENISPGRAQSMARYGDTARYAHAALKGAMIAGGAAVAGPIAAVGAAAILASMKSVNLEIGLAEELANRFRRRKTTALALVFGGMAAAFGLPPLVGAALSALFPDLRPATIGIAMIPFAVIGIVTMLTGIIYFAAAVRQPIKLRTTDGYFAWFTGAHPDFLASLPNFPRSPTQAQKDDATRSFLSRLGER